MASMQSLASYLLPLARSVAIGKKKKKRPQPRGFRKQEGLEEMLRSMKRQRGDNGGGGQQCCSPYCLVFHNSRCLRCDKELPEGDCRRTLVRLDSALEGLAIESRFLDQLKTRDLGAVRQGGKLLLVLDLDETLLHTEMFKDLLSKPVHDPQRELHVFETLEIATKLRPFAREFLRAASAMYDMRIYTMGSRMYAEAMAELLDPEGVYFGAGNRILCRADCTVEWTKGLDVVLGHASTVVVLDDTPSAWAEGDRGSVVHVRKYLWDPDGSDDDGHDSTLRTMLCLLGRIHADYFRQGTGGDVREIIRNARREILGGCRLLFADMTPPALSMGRGLVRRWDEVAEEMGATTSLLIDASSSEMVDWTHLVCQPEDATENAGAAVVDVGWLESAYFTWERPEDSRSATD